MKVNKKKSNTYSIRAIGSNDRLCPSLPTHRKSREQSEMAEVKSRTAF